MTIAPSAFELENADGDPIRGDIWSDPSQRPSGTAIVICHGFKGFKDWGFFPHLSRELAERTGYPVISFNFSGSGIGPDLEHFSQLDRFERNTFSKELDDLGTVLDAASGGRLRDLGHCNQFGLFGHSRGGGIAILKAAEDRRIACLVTWSAIASVDRWSDAEKERWRRDGRLMVMNQRTGQAMPLGLGLLEDIEGNADRLDIEGAATRLRVPLLIIHGTADESVPVDEAERLHELAPPGSTGFETIEGAGHTFGAVHPFVGPTEHLNHAIELTADWFDRHLQL